MQSLGGAVVVQAAARLHQANQAVHIFIGRSFASIASVGSAHSSRVLHPVVKAATCMTGEATCMISELRA